MDARPNTPSGDLLDVWVTLVEKWEADHYPIDPPDPVEALRFVMEQRGLSRATWSRSSAAGRVAEVLNHRRSLTLPMIRKLHSGLGIPAEVLIRETPDRPGRH